MPWPARAGAEPVDLVRRDADRGRDRLRAGVEPDRVAEIEPGDLRADDGTSRQSAQHDQREQDLLRAVLAQAAKELRPDAVADGEQEQQEEGRLDRPRDVDAQLADGDRRQQRRRDVAQVEAGQLLRADPEAERERQKERELRIRAQRFDKPVPDVHIMPCGARDGPSIRVEHLLNSLRVLGLGQRELEEHA